MTRDYDTAYTRPDRAGSRGSIRRVGPGTAAAVVVLVVLTTLVGFSGSAFATGSAVTPLSDPAQASKVATLRVAVLPHRKPVRRRVVKVVKHRVRRHHVKRHKAHAKIALHAAKKPASTITSVPRTTTSTPHTTTSTTSTTVVSGAGAAAFGRALRARRLQTTPISSKSKSKSSRWWFSLKAALALLLVIPILAFGVMLVGGDLGIFRRLRRRAS